MGINEVLNLGFIRQQGTRFYGAVNNVSKIQ